MEEMLIGMNYSMILCNYDNRSEKLIQKLTFMHQKKVDGVIFLSDEMISEPAKDLIKKMQTAGTSFVFVNGEVKGLEASTVLVDSINTIYESIVYLISHGHQRIGMICSPRSTWNAREREEGYRRVFLDYHMPVDEKRMFLYGDTKNAPDWQEDLKERSKDYLRANPDMTALILPGYRLTLIGLRAIHELCLKVGRDISIIGFDCGEISDVLDPALSYVSLPAEKMAKCAIDMLIHSIHHDAQQPRIVRIKAQLITRDSVCSL
jgi:LacI family transcriptional regulator